MNNIIIRQCCASDEAGFVKLNLQFMREVMEENPYWTTLKMLSEEEMKAVFHEALTKPQQIIIFVAELDNEIVGYANTWTVYSIFSGGKALTIDDLYIHTSYRRSGIGEKIMEYLNDFAVKNSYKRIQLHAELENKRAHNLYKKLGFNQEGMLFFMKKLD